MAPREDLLTEKGREFLAALPPFLRQDPSYRAVLHCCAREAERADAELSQLQRELNPLTASDVGLDFFETLMEMQSSRGQDVEARRLLVVRRFRALEGDPSGPDWVARVTARIGDVGWTYEESTGGPEEPTPQTLLITLPFAPISPQFAAARQVFAEETPTELRLIFISSEGFFLDSSQLDTDGLAV